MVAVTARDCQACPGIVQEERDQWIPTSQACPSGQTGTHTWERQQVASRNILTYCPYGTTTQPSPTFGGWSAWTDTGVRRYEVKTCTPSAPRCSDGSLQVVAWHSADWQDLPPASGSAGMSYWYQDAVVRLTPADKARLEWAINNVPIRRVETPAPIPGNWPANVSESAFYEEQCHALSDVGNIRYAYSYDFECVSGMGMHYCDYSWTNGARPWPCAARPALPTWRARATIPIVGSGPNRPWWRPSPTPPARANRAARQTAAMERSKVCLHATKATWA